MQKWWHRIWEFTVFGVPRIDGSGCLRGTASKEFLSQSTWQPTVCSFCLHTAFSECFVTACHSHRSHLYCFTIHNQKKSRDASTVALFTLALHNNRLAHACHCRVLLHLLLHIDVPPCCHSFHILKAVMWVLYHNPTAHNYVHAWRPDIIVTLRDSGKSAHLATSFRSSAKRLSKSENCLAKLFKNSFETMMQLLLKAGKSLLISLIVTVLSADDGEDREEMLPSDPHAALK